MSRKVGVGRGLQERNWIKNCIIIRRVDFPLGWIFPGKGITLSSMRKTTLLKIASWCGAAVLVSGFILYSGCVSKSELDELPESRTSEGGWTTGTRKGRESSERSPGTADAKGAAPGAFRTAEAKTAEPPGPGTGGEESALPPDGTAEDKSPETGGTGPSGLQAGYTDDNQQYNRYLSFLREYGGEANHRELPAEGRIRLVIRDSRGRPYPGVRVEPETKGAFAGGVTGASGIFDLYLPQEAGEKARDCRVRLELEGKGIRRTVTVSPEGRRTSQIELAGEREVPRPLPLDIVFVMDTTGSMGEEIERLRRMIEIIYMNLRTLSVETDIRFGMVMYKDKGDAYRTRGFQLTGDLQRFQELLETVQAAGGGDQPEDLEAALVDTLERINWSSRGVRLAYVVTDAPAHLDYEDLPYGYDEAARRAKARGIKIHTIGTGGLPLEGEYQLRQIAQHTGGRYIFLTYGEPRESTGGQPGSVSHHSGANFQTDRLESIIINFTKEEVRYLTQEEVSLRSGYFQADPVDYESRRETLMGLMDRLLSELYDYASLDLAEEVPLLIGPVVPGGAETEFLRESLRMAAVKSRPFQPVERQEAAVLLRELEFQESGAVSPDSAQRLGEISGAEAALFGHFFPGKEYSELTVRLVRISTGEILSASRARIKNGLLLSGEE